MPDTMVLSCRMRLNTDVFAERLWECARLDAEYLPISPHISLYLEASRLRRLRPLSCRNVVRNE